MVLLKFLSWEEMKVSLVQISVVVAAIQTDYISYIGNEIQYLYIDCKALKIVVEKVSL